MERLVFFSKGLVLRSLTWALNEGKKVGYHKAYVGLILWLFTTRKEALCLSAGYIPDQLSGHNVFA